MASKKPRKPNRMQQNRTPSRTRPASAVLESAKESLQHTEAAFAALKRGTRDDRRAALRNLIMNGRTVTWPLQVLTEDCDPPDENGHGNWYRERVANRLRSDPVARFFVNLRNLIEKEGILEVSEVEVPGIYISHLDTNDVNVAAPPGTVGWTMGFDGIVRYRLADGSEVDRTQAFPGTHPFTAKDYAFADTPPDLGLRTVEDLSREYVEILQQIIVEAIVKFGHLP